MSEIVLLGAEQHQQEMDNAHQGLEGCAKPVYYPVRGSDAAAVEKFRLHKIQDTLTIGLRGKEKGLSISA